MLFCVVFFLSVRFIVLTAVKTPAGVGAARLLVADRVAVPPEPAGRAPGPRLHPDHGIHQQHDHHRGQRRPAWWCSAAMAAFVLQRRKSRWTTVINLVMLSGLIIPPAVVPTIWVMQKLELFKTMPGTDPGGDRVRAGVLRAAVPGVHLDDPAGAGRGRDHRRRGAAEPLLPGRVPAAEADHRHGRRRADGLRLERLPERRCTSCPATRTPRFS